MNWESAMVVVIGVATAAWAGRSIYRAVAGKNKKNAMGCSGDCACPGAKQPDKLFELQEKKDEPR